MELLTKRQIEGFKAIEKLEKDWNSYGALPINKEILKQAKFICSLIGPECEMNPCIDGSINLFHGKFVISINIDPFEQ